MAGLDLGAVCVDEKAIVGSYSSDICLQPASARFCFREGRFLHELITETYPLGQTAEAIHAVSQPTGTRLKVMVAP